jgi:hypothetical protein
VRDRQVSTQRKVTSEAITGGSRKEPRQPYPIPGHCILLADDFGDGGRVQWVSGRPGADFRAICKYFQIPGKEEGLTITTYSD